MVVGLTGQTGAGKSTVSAMIKDWPNLTIIDCDALSRRVAKKGNRCLLDLAVEFSPLIIDSEGNLNRRKLAQVVFRDKAKLKRLNEIIFPYIVEEAEKEIADAKARGVRVIILDAPTLFESGADRLCDKIVVITAKDTIRLARILERDNITPDEAAARMGSQLSEQFFIEHADFVIDNTGDKVELRLAVLELLNELGL